MHKFLKKCKKAFKDKDLILYKGKYPYNEKDNIINNKSRGSLTTEQLFVCNLLLKRDYFFMVEKKIKHGGLNNNNHYLDILVKGKYHFFDLEIDGLHHNKIKAQKRKDLKKEGFILKNHDIITIRIKNSVVNDYINDRVEKLDEKLSLLNKKRFNRFNKDFYVAENIGTIKRKLSEL